MSAFSEGVPGCLAPGTCIHIQVRVDVWRVGGGGVVGGWGLGLGSKPLLCTYEEYTGHDCLVLAVLFVDVDAILAPRSLSLSLGLGCLAVPGSEDVPVFLKLGVSPEPLCWVSFGASGRRLHENCRATVPRHPAPHGFCSPTRGFLYLQRAMGKHKDTITVLHTPDLRRDAPHALQP